MHIKKLGPSGGARRTVLRFAFSLAVVTYLDRVCISAAAPFIMRDLDLSVVQVGFVFSAFTLAYSMFEIPTAWMGDVLGPRRVLTRIVLWWSAFTMLTASARSFLSLVTIRFLFGAGEAGAFPNRSRRRLADRSACRCVWPAGGALLAGFFRFCGIGRVALRLDSGIRPPT
jgi:MFS family permease